MDKAWERTARLIGNENVERLQKARVILFGVGGVGSYAAEALARCGVGSLTLVDHDVVDQTNLNRQLVALHSTIGRPKTEILKARILDINPSATVDAVQCFYDADTALQFDFKAYDYIIDAVDTVTAKLLLIENAARAGTKIISSMGAGNKLNPAAFEVADIYSTSICPLARVMRRECRKRGINALKVVYSKEEPRKSAVTEQEGGKAGAATKQAPGSISFVPSAAGLVLAGAVVRDLLEL